MRNSGWRESRDISRWRRAVMCLVLAAASLPLSVQVRAQTVPPIASRHWLPAPTLVRTIAGADGDEILMPGNLVALNNRELALFDFGAMEVRAFSVNGKQLWRTGRKGAGPGEFRNAMDIKALPNGNLAVLDMGNRRVTELTGSGRLVRTIPVRFTSSRFIPLADTTVLALTTEDSGSFWSAVNRRGEVVSRGSAPASIVRQHSLVREMFTTPVNGGSIIAFRWSDTFAILTALGKVATVINGIEHVPFPAIKSYPMKVGKFSGQVSRIEPKAVMGALSIASNGQQIFILFGGATANRGRIVDRYNASSGAYIGSELLSVPALEIVSLSNGAFATLRTDPLPAIDVWNRSSIPAAKSVVKKSDGGVPVNSGTNRVTSKAAGKRRGK